MKILFFTESLRQGGKERRLIELFFYLKRNTNYELMLVLTEKDIHYDYIKKLDIPIVIIQRKYLKKDPSLFFRFYRIAKMFQPDIIHTWGVMSTFYSIPAKLILKRALISNLVANAKKQFKNYSLANFFFKMDIYFSDIVLGNSQAGLNEYKMPQRKAHLIYNGVRLERFNSQTDKNNIRTQLNIKTQYIAIMVASASKNKDYDLLLDVAKKASSQHIDITFVGVGGGVNLSMLRTRKEKEKINNLILLGTRNDVEVLVAASDIGLLFTKTDKHCEGISNSIMEYMALGKPVITTDTCGGSKELIEDGSSGFILNEDLNLILSKLTSLIENPNLRKSMGNRGKEIIKNKFTIDIMGKNYVKIYEELF